MATNVLVPGRLNCRTLEKRARAALREPVIDGHVVHSGSVPSVANIEGMLTGGGK